LSRDSQVWILKFPKLGLLQLWRFISLCTNLQLRWGLKQSCSPLWELFTSMWHITCTQGSQGNFWFLMIKSQIDNLTFSHSFGHNLRFNDPNGSCELILDIYVLRAFQWYKKRFNPMSFDPYNCSLKIQKSIKTLTPKVGAHLGVWGFILSHSPTFPLHSWPTPLQALALVASQRLGLPQWLSPTTHSKLDTMIFVTCYTLKIKTHERKMKNIEEKKLGRP